MEPRNSNGWQTFLEHYAVLLVCMVSLISSQVLNFFTGLTGTLWISLVVVSCSLMLFGASWIGYAKFPLYRTGRFFTFGPRFIPHHRLRCYRWGWGVFLFGAGLTLCLLLARH